MAALFSGIVSLKLQTVAHARAHLDELAKKAPSEKYRAVALALRDKQIEIEVCLIDFLAACKEAEAAEYPTTKPIGGTAP